MASLRGGDKAAMFLGRIVGALQGATSVEVGFFEDAKYPTTGTSVPMVAAIQEFGAPRRGIPPRPYFRPLVAKNKVRWPKAAADLLKANRFDARKTLDQMGEAIAGQLRTSITEVHEPPLSEVTLMLRKMFGNAPERIRFRDVTEARRRVAAGETAGDVSRKPLVWTGYLLSRIDYRVK